MKKVALLFDTQKFGLEANAEKTRYTLMSCEHNAEESHNIDMGSKSSAGLKKFKYLRTALTNKQCDDEEIRSRLKSRNA